MSNSEKKSWLWEDYKIELFMIVKDNKLCIETRDNIENNHAEIDILERKDCGIIISLRKLLAALGNMDSNHMDNLLERHGFKKPRLYDDEEKMELNFIEMDIYK